LFEGQVGVLSEEVRSEIVSDVIDLLRAGETPSEGESTDTELATATDDGLRPNPIDGVSAARFVTLSARRCRVFS
jgi:hypothetical protein